MKNRLVALGLLAPLALAACGSHGSSSGTVPTGFKVEMRYQAMQATPLTDAQKAELVAMTKSHAQSLDASIFFTKDANDSKKSLAKLNDAGRKDVDLVKSKCQIDPGKDSASPVLPDGGLGGETHQQISGKDCPIAYKSDSKTTTSIYDIDPTTKNYSAKGHVEGSSSETISDGGFQKDFYVIDSEVGYHSDSVLTNYNHDDSGNLTAGSNYELNAITGVLKTTDSTTMKIVAKFETYASVGHVAKQTLETFTLPDGTPVVLWASKIDGVSEVILNGEPYTTDRLNQEFGSMGDLP